MAPASAKGGLGFSNVARQTRRLSGPCGGAPRQDVLVAGDVSGCPISGADNGAWVAYRKAKKKAAGKKRGEKAPKPQKKKIERNGQTLIGFNRRSRVRRRRSKCHAEYHLAPERHLRDAPRSDSSPRSEEDWKAHRSSYSTISMRSPVSAQESGLSEREQGGPMGKQSFPTTLDLDCMFVFAEADSVAAFGAGANAHFACSRLLERRNRILERTGLLRVSTYPACARFRFGGGRLGAVRHTADIAVGKANNAGEFTAPAPEAEIPALSLKCALEPLGGQAESPGIFRLFGSRRWMFPWR